ncbi:DUF262 domain-containing protein [uncultured Psychrobacter sp.]|uniref:DUF262 domain-containing protein n=2 Tax=Moraxellaceae TaxID=468 RepID=UPI000ED52BFF|nr:DUF262 domain-containing protein [uncultured Psychrobacter sp.]HCI31921.1 DUF262 domain-containing protein [Psychrobacter sp.]
MIAYQIRSVQLINLVRDIKNGNLITNAYFQRNLVWREVNKKELIKTVLDGYPFPLIFISKGEIDVERMISTSCIVDGQQRSNAIVSFVNNEYHIDGRYFKDFSEDEKANFFKYEIPVCELDIKNTDPRLLDIFQRINRTSDSLTGIEKKASEYGASYFMLVCQMLCNQIDVNLADKDNEDFKLDPNIPESFLNWARDKTNSCENIQKLLTDERIFSIREISRKVNLQYTLNIVSTYLAGFYTRNDKVDEYLLLYLEDFNMKDEIVNRFEKVAEFYLRLELDDKSMWFNKANMFSLFIALANYSELDSLDISKFSEILNQFDSLDVYDHEYMVWAKEGVNNLKERRGRHKIIMKYILNIPDIQEESFKD